MIRIPVERMTNWELVDRLQCELKRLNECAIDEFCSNTREVLLNLDGQIETALSDLRGFAEEHDENTGEPCSVLHGETV